MKLPTANKAVARFVQRSGTRDVSNQEYWAIARIEFLLELRLIDMGAKSNYAGRLPLQQGVREATPADLS